jgi:hypothetical protein
MDERHTQGAHIFQPTNLTANLTLHAITLSHYTRLELHFRFYLYVDTFQPVLKHSSKLILKH